MHVYSEAEKHASDMHLLSEIAMRLTCFTDFAVRVMLYLATRENRGCSIGEIVWVHGISSLHLTEVVSDLAGAGFVQSLRGPSGGIGPTRPDCRNRYGSTGAPH